MPGATRCCCWRDGHARLVASIPTCPALIAGLHPEADNRKPST